jgi:hypothetical protein
MFEVLTPEDIERLLRQKGFGNPSGPYWFIGQEEGGGGSVEELRVRARDIREIDDFGRVHALPSFYLDRTKHVTSTWIIMSKIVLRLEGRDQWRSSEAALEYQARHLGQPDGDTFLAEIMPLPAPRRRTWPYPWLFPTRDDYERTVRPIRIALLRRLVEDHRPRFVFGYGKGYGHWDDHRAVFDGVQFNPALNGRILLGHLGMTIIVLTPFFHYWLMTSDMIQGMAEQLERSAAPGAGPNLC